MSPAATLPRIRFDRHELAGAFGDLGTDLPLLVGLVATCHLDAASVCIVYGLLQMLTGLTYGIPMPVQPLKAMAAIMLAQKLSPGTYAGGGLVIGAGMLLLAVTGGLELLAKLVPRAVVRGIQVGLGVSLASIALKSYASEGGWHGYLMAGVAFVALLVLRRQKKIPAPLVVVGAGVVFALVFRVSPSAIAHGMGLSAPHLVIPTGTELRNGALLLAIPQLPLSLGNSVFATAQTAGDLFPQRPITVRRIGFTYALMNLVGPLFGGVPTCHGCGGLVGFHAFGARTGGAPILYGGMYLVMGLFFGPGFGEVVRVFPLPILAVVLVVEAVGLMALVRDVMGNARDVWIAMLVAVSVVGLPYGYLVGLVLGTAVWWAGRAPQGAS